MAKRVVYTMEDFRSPPKNESGWKRVCRDRILSEKFIEDHADEVDWVNVSTYQARYISLDFALRFKKRIAWYAYLIARKNANMVLSEEELEKCFSEGLFTNYGNSFWAHCEISVNFIRRHESVISNASLLFMNQRFSEEELEEIIGIAKSISDSQWRDISYFQNFSDAFIFRHLSELNVTGVLGAHKLPEETLKKIIDMKSPLPGAAWSAIAQQNISENFIRRHKNELPWETICSYQKLTEPFMEEMSDFLSWPDVSARQKLSEPFIRKHINQLSLEDLCLCQVLPERLIEDFAYKLTPDCWSAISYHQTMSEDFMARHKKDIDWKCVSMYGSLTMSFIRRFWDLLDHDALAQRRDLPFSINCA